MFKNLNLFIAEELLPLDISPDYLRLDKIEIKNQDDNLSVTTFSTVTVISNIDAYSELTIDDERATPIMFKPLLTTLYYQLFRLLTEDVHQLKPLMKYPMDNSGEGSVVNVLKNYMDQMVNDLASVFELRLHRSYDNVYDYANSSNKNDMLANLNRVVLFESVESRLTVKNSIVHGQGQQITTSNYDNRDDFRLSPRAEKYVQFGLDDDETHLVLNQIQQLSLFRLIWTVEAIRKVKYGIYNSVTTILFLDDINTQIRHLYTPLYSTSFNLDSLEILNQSPEFKTRLKTAKLIIYHRIMANSPESGRYYKSIYSIVGHQRGLEPTLITLSSHTYNYYDQFLMYEFAFLPWEQNNKMDLVN